MVLAKDGVVRKSSAPLIDYQWNVLDTATIELKLDAVSGVNRTDYFIAVELPVYTGLQFADDADASCDWKPYESASNPNRYRYRLTHGSKLYLVRCHIGNGASNMKIYAYHKEAANKTKPWKPIDFTVEPSWHRNDARINYQNCQYPTGNKADIEVIENAILKGGHFWIAPSVKLSIGKIRTPDCTEGALKTLIPVSIRLVSDATAKSECGSELRQACVEYLDQSPFYPHHQPLTIWIREDPVSSNNIWATRIKDMSGLDVYYLPGTVAHEMGHTAGLGHSEGRIIGVMGLGFAQRRLSVNDVTAINAIYGGHVDHE